MTHVNQTQAPGSHEIDLEASWLRGLVGPFVIAAVGVIAVAVLVVFTSKSAWQLLGAGRGLVAPASYHYIGLLMVLGTTFGQFVGWAAGSAILVYIWYLLGAAITFRVAQVSMSMAYCVLAIVPIFFYHSLFGQPLAGLPRHGVAAWVRQNHPGAYWLLFPGHVMIDVLVIPLLIAVLVLIWKTDARLMHHRGLQTLVLFLLLITSLAVALSLGIHSTHAHIRLGV